jgi:hypothetical protein
MPTTFNLPFTITDATGTLSVNGQIMRLTPGVPSIFRSVGPLPSHAFDDGTINVAGQVFGVDFNNTFNIILTANNITLNFLVHDDDDDTLLPKSPDTSLLAAALQEAYVEPKFNTPGVANSNSLNALAFDANLAGGEQFTNIVRASVLGTDPVWGSVAANQPDFWVIYIISAFQHTELRDGDPDSERFSPGLVEGNTLVPIGTSAIFLETIRETAGFVGISQTVEEQATATHEPGHAMGRSATEDVLQCDHPDICTPPTIRYTPEYLDFIRDAPLPGP